jgi:hypothetical protein
MSGYKDDGPEAKGTNVNVRIWNNRIIGDQANSCIAGNTTNYTIVYGPLYIFRNSCLVTSASVGAAIFKLGARRRWCFITPWTRLPHHYAGTVSSASVRPRS